MGFLSNAKDRLIEKFGLPYLNRSVLAPYGQARELHINTTDNSAEIILELKGELEPLRVTVGRYELFEEAGRTFVTIHAISTSREWATALAQHKVVGQPFPVPEEFDGVLKTLA